MSSLKVGPWKLSVKSRLRVVGRRAGLLLPLPFPFPFLFSVSIVSVGLDWGVGASVARVPGHGLVV